MCHSHNCMLTVVLWIRTAPYTHIFECSSAFCGTVWEKLGGLFGRRVTLGTGFEATVEICHPQSYLSQGYLFLPHCSRPRCDLQLFICTHIHTNSKNIFNKVYLYVFAYTITPRKTFTSVIKSFMIVIKKKNLSNWGTKKAVEGGYLRGTRN